jgi:hypothetical protein
MGLSKWSPTIPIGVDDAKLDSDRITTLEEILAENYSHDVSFSSLEQLNYPNESRSGGSRTVHSLLLGT